MECCHRVCKPHTQVIVAVDGERGEAERGDDHRDPFRSEEADGIAETEPVGTMVKPPGIDRFQECGICPGGVLPGELHDEAPLLCIRDGVHRHRVHLVPALPEFLLDVEVAYRDDEMHRVGTVLCCIVDVKRDCTDVRADLGREPGVRDEPQGLAFPFRSNRGSRLDHVDTDLREARCNLQFLNRFQRDTGSLFPVP